MMLSNHNLRLCVLMRLLGQKLPAQRAVPVFECQRAAAHISKLDIQLGESLMQAFKNREGTMPIDQAMEIVDLYLEHRSDP